MILVTGATGNVGGAVVRALVAEGVDVRAAVRDPEQVELPPGVQAVAADLNRAETLRPAFADVTAAFLLSGYEGLNRSLTEMRRAGVERVVLLSSGSVPSGDETNAVTRYHMLSERAVRDSGRRWTFLQPNSFMANSLRWVPQLRDGNVVRAPFADVAIATIDPADVAAVAVRGLVSDELAGRSLRLSGPEALYPADQVRILGSALDRELRCEAITDDVAREEMSASMPAEYVDAFFRFFVDGTIDETTVHTTVEDVLGRKPRSYEQWVAEHLDAFR